MRSRSFSATWAEVPRSAPAWRIGRTEGEHALWRRIQNCRAEKCADSGLHSRPEICRGTEGSNLPLSGGPSAQTAPVGEAVVDHHDSPYWLTYSTRSLESRKHSSFRDG